MTDEEAANGWSRPASEALAEVDRRLRAAFGDRYVSCHVLGVVEECSAALAVILSAEGGKPVEDATITRGVCYDVLVETGIHFHPKFIDVSESVPPAKEPADFRQWYLGQAAALRRWQWSALDWERLALTLEELAAREEGTGG